LPNSILYGLIPWPPKTFINTYNNVFTASSCYLGISAPNLNDKIQVKNKTVRNRFFFSVKGKYDCRHYRLDEKIMYSRIKESPHITQALKPIGRERLPETKRNVNIKIVISYYKLYIVQIRKTAVKIYNIQVRSTIVF